MTKHIEILSSDRRSMYWILNDKNEPVHPKSIKEWSDFLFTKYRWPRKLKKKRKKLGLGTRKMVGPNRRKIVALTDLPNGLGRVSTVFLGLDHGYMSRPLFFETMVFGGEHDEYMNRYTTWDEAKRGHQEVIEMIFNVERKEK